MSDAATAAKAAKMPVSKTVQGQRYVQPKKFAPSSLKSIGYGDSDIMTVTAPPGMTFTEAMAPIAWANVAPIVARDALATRNVKDGVGTVIILDDDSNTYHAHLRIKRVVRDQLNNPCGLEVVCIGPSIDPKTFKACPIDVQTGDPWVDAISKKQQDAA